MSIHLLLLSSISKKLLVAGGRARLDGGGWKRQGQTPGASWRPRNHEGPRGHGAIVSPPTGCKHPSIAFGFYFLAPSGWQRCKIQLWPTYVGGTRGIFAPKQTLKGLRLFFRAHALRAPDLAAAWTPSIYQIPKYLLDFPRAHFDALHAKTRETGDTKSITELLLFLFFFSCSTSTSRSGNIGKKLPVQFSALLPCRINKGEIPGVARGI